MSDIFMKATRQALRFPSKAGMLTTEQLWTLPLQSVRNASLDDVGRRLLAQQKSFSQESLLSTGVTDEQRTNSLAIEVVKTVIAIRQSENQAATESRQKAQERQQLLDILERKKTQSLENLSEEEIRERLNKMN